MLADGIALSERGGQARWGMGAIPKSGDECTILNFLC